MRKKQLLTVAWIIPMVIGITLNGAEPSRAGELAGRGVTMKEFLRHRAQQAYEQWKLEYEDRKTPEQIGEYQTRCTQCTVRGCSSWRAHLSAIADYLP